MARDSGLSPAGLISLELAAAVRDDLAADGVLYGTGTRGPLALGTCSGVCLQRSRRSSFMRSRSWPMSSSLRPQKGGAKGDCAGDDGPRTKVSYL